MSDTAGKGPGIVLHAHNGSGAVRVCPRHRRNLAVLEVLDLVGGITHIRLSPDELRVLAAAFMKVAAALQATAASEEITQS
ncbi:MAG: hypothetical protein HYZ28_15235 [Myxococcales bacterium]|nr:hypothetical protein [Myxococcales bacterium]